MDVKVMDYDAGGYDYRNFWHGRDAEHRIETAALTRLLTRQLRGGRVHRFVDLGGGFGRHLPTYRRFADHVVLVDRSLTNLRNAAASGLDPVEGVGVDLVRADVYRLPLRDRAFDAGACVRVLHHLTDLDGALAEMGRVLDRNWLLDVPIHHHLRARLRALPQRPGHDPLLRGTLEDPYWNFHLGTVRRRLSLLGWDTRTAASLHNLRGLPPAGPGPLESLLQRAGRGWWGPSQIVLADRAPAAGRPVPGEGIEALLVCPGCRGDLRFDGPVAGCAACAVEYRRDNGIWDFVRALPLGSGTGTVPGPRAVLPVGTR